MLWKIDTVSETRWARKSTKIRYQAVYFIDPA